MKQRIVHARLFHSRSLVLGMAIKPNILTSQMIQSIHESVIRIILLAALIIFAGPQCAIFGQALVPKPRPNVLMIVIDDLNDWVGYVSNERDDSLLDILVPDEEKRKRLKNYLTPNIDKLAASGVAFSDAHCNCPLCGPSRVSFLTGVLPSTTGFYLNDKRSFRESIANGADYVTLPQHFKRQGYLTVEAGKVFHLGRTGRKKQKSPEGSDPQSWSAQHIGWSGTRWKFKPRISKGVQYLGNPWKYDSGDVAKQILRSNESSSLSRVPVPHQDRWHRGIIPKHFPDFFNWGILPEPGDVWYHPSTWSTTESTHDYRHADFIASFLSGASDENRAKFLFDNAPKTLSVSKGLPKRKPDQPFFVAYGGHRPHAPFIVPKSFRDSLQEIISPEDLDLEALDQLNHATRFGKTANQIASLANLHNAITMSGEETFGDRYHHWREALYMYLASVNFADACIGRVLEGYEQCPEKENTIIVMLSDHGWHLGSKKHWSKMTLWQEATHIPLIIKAPGIEPAKCDAPVSLVSIFPTLVELAGLKSPAELDSKAQMLDGPSLVPLLMNPNLQMNKPVIASYRLSSYTECITAIDREWRFIHYKSSGEEALYDRRKDPFETNNLVDESNISLADARVKDAYIRLKLEIEHVLSNAASNVATLNSLTAARFRLHRIATSVTESEKRSTFAEVPRYQICEWQTKETFPVACPNRPSRSTSSHATLNMPQQGGLCFRPRLFRKAQRRTRFR